MHTHTVYVCVNFFLTWLTKCGKNDMKNTHTITQSVCTALNTTEWAKSEKSGYTNNKLNISKKRRRSKEEDVHVGHKHISIQINKKKKLCRFCNMLCFTWRERIHSISKSESKSKRKRTQVCGVPNSTKTKCWKTIQPTESAYGFIFFCFLCEFFCRRLYFRWAVNLREKYMNTATNSFKKSRRKRCIGNFGKRKCIRLFLI